MSRDVSNHIENYLDIILCFNNIKINIEKILNTKVKVCSPDGDTDYFDIVTCVLQGDTLAPQSSCCIATYHSRKLSKLDEPDMQDPAGEVGTNS